MELAGYWAAAASSDRGPCLRSKGGQLPYAKQHVPLGSGTERQECMARKLFITFVLPFRHFYCSGCYHRLSVLVNNSFKQLCNCIELVKGTTATEPQDNTYAPISVRILLWQKSSGSSDYGEVFHGNLLAPEFLCHTFLSGSFCFCCRT